MLLRGEGKRERERGKEENRFLTSFNLLLSVESKNEKNFKKKQTTNAVYNLTVGKAINATVYKVRKKRKTGKKIGQKREREK